MIGSPIAIGDRFRLREHPRAPLLTVEELYLQGERQELWAGCSWQKKAQLVHFPVADLEVAS